MEAEIIRSQSDDTQKQISIESSKSEDLNTHENEYNQNFLNQVHGTEDFNAPGQNKGKDVFWRDDVAAEWTEDTTDELMRTVLNKHADICELLLSEERKLGLTVFLIGPTGHGKSSTINGLLSALNNQHTERAIVRTKKKHATTVFRKYRTSLPYEDSNGNLIYNDVLNVMNFVINFADFIGPDGDKKTEDGSGPDITNQLLAAVRGILKEGRKAEKTDEEAKQVLNVEEKELNVKEPIEQACCVLLVVELKSEESHIQPLKKIIDYAVEQDIRPVLILTKCDLVDAEVKHDPRKIYISKDIKAEVEKTAECVGVPLYRTFPVKNYVHEMKMKPQLRYQYLYLLQFVLIDIETKLKELIRKDPDRRAKIKAEFAKCETDTKLRPGTKRKENRNVTECTSNTRSRKSGRPGKIDLQQREGATQSTKTSNCWRAAMELMVVCMVCCTVIFVVVFGMLLRSEDIVERKALNPIV